MTMRMLLAAGALLTMLQTPGQAFFNTTQYEAWCMNMAFVGATDCSFYTYEQCAVSVVGIGGYCYPSPWARSAERPRRPQRVR